MACDSELLVSLVEKRPSIFDYNDKHHSNRVVQDKLWEEISLEMNCDVSICKSKWTSLRNSFARELRELKNKKSGSASSKKRKWYLFESMSFLADFMLQHKKMASNISDIYVEETEENRESDEEQNVIQVEENTTVEESIITESEPDFRQPVFKKPKKKEYKTASEKVAEPMIEFLKSRTNKPIHVEDRPELLFFKSLIPDYNKLNEKNQRRFKNDMLTTLNNYLDEQEHIYPESIVAK